MCSHPVRSLIKFFEANLTDNCVEYEGGESHRQTHEQAQTAALVQISSVLGGRATNNECEVSTQTDWATAQFARLFLSLVRNAGDGSASLKSNTSFRGEF